MTDTHISIKANDGKTYLVPVNPEWKSGPPPAIGWWPASRFKDIKGLRWWSGEWWSYSARPEFSASEARLAAKYLTHRHGTEIQWCARWWE